MSGFTIYETLRIFLPGALAVAMADALLRLATGRAVIDPSPEVAAAVNLMEGPGTEGSPGVADSREVGTLVPTDRRNDGEGLPRGDQAQGC